jgi:hypothetical protein
MMVIVAGSSKSVEECSCLMFEVHEPHAHAYASSLRQAAVEGCVMQWVRFYTRVRG